MPDRGTGRRTVLGLIAAALSPLVLPARLAAHDGPLDDRGASRITGSLPDMNDPRPAVPRVIDMGATGRAPGRSGGTIRTLIGGQKDIRLMTLYGYARLVGYDQSLALVPDILRAVDTADDRTFTFHIRPGHRWSDGSPFTAEDFRYCWEDVLLDKDLRPGDLPDELLAGGGPPRFQRLDDLTVRYQWDDPNPRFLPRLAAPQPLVIAMPSAYLRQFHRKYQDPIRLSALIQQQRVETWVDLHTKMSRSYRPENPDLPMLDPWVNTTPPPANQFVFVRNRYFHRVDEAGVQLPYVDKVVLNVSSPAIIPAKAGAGETDLQAMGLAFDDYRYLKAAEKLHPVKVALWRRTQGSAIALLPNLTCKDEGWRTLFRDRNVRRALSLAIDRHEINMVSFFGLARESADTVLPDSPLFRPEYAEAWATHDPAKAGALLDAAGLDRRDGDGIRLLPDGRLAEIIVESAGESTLETDVLELIGDHWREVGIKLFVRVSQRDLFRSRAMSGDAMMSVWGGLDNGVPTADMSPAALAPTADDQLQWPLWGIHYLTHGAKGQEPDLPRAQELLDLFGEWSRSPTAEERTAAWQAMLAIRADEVFSIGTVNSTLQPVLYSSALRNVPDKALFGFDPTSYLGIYMPDTFWLDEGA